MRKNNKRSLRPKIFVYCNGEIAEPEYFRTIKNSLCIPQAIEINHSHCKGKSPWELIEFAIEKKKEVDELDKIWCVFDIDHYLEENKQKMNEAVRAAKVEGVNLAWSNICFELWLLLHFIPFNSSFGGCADYECKLKQHCKTKLSIIYRKNLNISSDLLLFQSVAIANAKKIDTGKISKNPSTTVYRLIEQLNQIKR
jgi:hypothetical protein